MNIHEKFEALEQANWTYEKEEMGKRHVFLCPHPLWEKDNYGRRWCSSVDLKAIINFCYDQENKWRQENDS